VNWSLPKKKKKKKRRNNCKSRFAAERSTRTIENLWNESIVFGLPEYFHIK